MVEDLPRGWRLVDLGDLGGWHGGGTPSKGQSDYWTSGTVPWLSPKDMWADVIATGARITDDDLGNAPYNERGGIQVLSPELTA